MKRGTVAVPHGWGHRGGGWRVANGAGGANVNALASSDPVRARAARRDGAPERDPDPDRAGGSRAGAGSGRGRDPGCTRVDVQRARAPLDSNDPPVESVSAAQASTNGRPPRRLRTWRRSSACSTTIRSTATRRAYPRDDVPRSSSYPGGQTTPTPEAIDFTPGRAARQRLRRARPARASSRPPATAGRHLGQGRPRLGVRARAARRRGRHLPALLARLPDRRADRQGAEPQARDHRRHRLRPRRPAGGDRRGITVAEVTYCNSISVSEHVVMMILALVRNYIPSLQDRRRRRLEHRRRGLALLRPRGHAGRDRRRRADRLGGAAAAEAVRRRPSLHRPPPPAAGASRRSSAPPSTSGAELVAVCDVVTINAPLHPETEHLFDDELIGTMKRGAYLVNTARGKICDRDAVVRALESGPAGRLRRRRLVPAARPADHPWRTMPHHGMTPHTRARASRRRPATRPARARSSSAGSTAARSATST